MVGCPATVPNFRLCALPTSCREDDGMIHPITRNTFTYSHLDLCPSQSGNLRPTTTPFFSLLMKQKLESLHCLTNTSKGLFALLLLVLISNRMGLAGLSEVINIRGHKAMLIEWSPHCHARGVSLLTPFLSQSFPFHPDSPSPFSLVCLSYKSLETLHCWRWLFPPTALRKQALFEVDGGAAERV